MLEYIHRRYKPLRDDLVCEYYVEPHPKYTLEQVSEFIAGESSIGTWTDIATMNPEIAIKLRPSVYSINKKKSTIKIAYNNDLFEPGNMPQILSSIAGNIFGMKAVDNLKLLDIHFPKKLVKSFKGPQFGIKGIRKKFQVKNRPLLGTIVKPKVGLTPTQHAQVAYDAWNGGLDIVKDDENLTNLVFNRFEERVIKTLDARDRAASETGEFKMYMPNVTAETDEMIKRADFVKDHGGEYVMVDIMTAGWSALQTLRNLEMDLVIHAHRAGHAAITRNPYHGISMLTLAKVARLIGADQLDIGSVVGKIEGQRVEVQEIEEEIDSSFIPKRKTHSLNQSWFGTNTTLPVAAGGLHPAHVPKIMKLMGKDNLMLFGGGCHGHPNGTYAGAKAIRQAVDATLKRRRVETYAQTHFELKEALVKFGLK